MVCIHVAVVPVLHGLYHGGIIQVFCSVVILTQHFHFAAKSIYIITHDFVCYFWETPQLAWLLCLYTVRVWLLSFNPNPPSPDHLYLLMYPEFCYSRKLNEKHNSVNRHMFSCILFLLLLFSWNTNLVLYIIDIVIYDTIVIVCKAYMFIGY